MSLFNIMRTVVSKDKIRFQEGEYDLDLTYITDRVIAMGFPASGVEATYRNDIREVSRFLKERHGTHFLVWNLTQRSYDYSMFDHQIKNAGFPDHHAPPLVHLFRTVRGISLWLAQDPRNVAVIHCLAGKGRTGTVISAYLQFCGLFDSAERSVRFFGCKRSVLEMGVQQPSQVRYVHYFANVLSSHSYMRPRKRYIRRVEISPVPNVGKLGGIFPLLQIFDARQLPYNLLTNTAWSMARGHINRHYPPSSPAILIDMDVLCQGDTLLRFFHVSRRITSKDKTVPVFRCAFHTAFLSYTDTLVFSKKELDLAHTDKHIPSNFTVRIFFDPDEGDADGCEQSEWSEEEHNAFLRDAEVQREVSEDIHKRLAAATSCISHLDEEIEGLLQDAPDTAADGGDELEMDGKGESRDGGGATRARHSRTLSEGLSEVELSKDEKDQSRKKRLPAIRCRGCGRKFPKESMKDATQCPLCGYSVNVEKSRLAMSANLGLLSIIHNRGDHRHRAASQHRKMSSTAVQLRVETAGNAEENAHKPFEFLVSVGKERIAMVLQIGPEDEIKLLKPEDMRVEETYYLNQLRGWMLQPPGHTPSMCSMDFAAFRSDGPMECHSEQAKDISRALRGCIDAEITRRKSLLDAPSTSGNGTHAQHKTSPPPLPNRKDHLIPERFTMHSTGVLSGHQRSSSAGLE